MTLPLISVLIVGFFLLFNAGRLIYHMNKTKKVKRVE